MNGLARVESAAGVTDFQVISGISSERMMGTRLRVAVVGDTRLVMAEDPTGAHLPLAAPLDGDATVRRLVLPPRTDTGYNLATAAGSLALDDLESLGTLSEDEIKSLLRRGPDEAVLIYLYNPERPLALTGAPLEAYATPFGNVTVLRAAGEPEDATLALVIVALDHTAYDTWSNRPIDRYLSGRIGQRPDTDLRGDLAFRWSYPVFDVFPADPQFTVNEGEELLLRVNWRSQSPDPPPPWSFFVTTDDDRLTVEPEAFQLGPESPPAEIHVTVDRSGLEAGEYTGKVFIQPFSDAFGMIEQGVERNVLYTVSEAAPAGEGGEAAEEAASGGAVISLDPTTPRQGQRLTVIATGFEPEEAVLLEFVGIERTIRDTLQTADDTGTFTYDIDLSTVPGGDYTLTLTGTVSGVVGETPVVVGEKIPDAIVNSSELNLRTGPGYDYPAVDVLVSGDELDVIAVNWDDSWLEVITTTGSQGWVVTDLVELNITLEDVPWNSRFPNPNQ